MRLRRLQSGYIPADEESIEQFRKHKLGSVLHGDFKLERNYQFHRKYFALLQIAYEAWEESCLPVQYKGMDVMPSFERFRKDLTILCGHYKATFNVRNEVRLEAESISFGKMDEATFAKLFDKTITVILHKVLPRGRFTETELRGLVDTVSEFA